MAGGVAASAKLGQRNNGLDVATKTEDGRVRRWLIISLLLFPTVAGAVSAEEARHLLVRTGFDASVETMAKLKPLSYEAAVRQLLDGVRSEPLTAAPAWINDPPPDPKQLKSADETARKQMHDEQRQHAIALKAWWYREMLETDSPLTERLTLFWHNHFTSSLQKVKWPPYLYQQNLLLRRYALGNFAAMLHAVARDPAMLIYLDSQKNHRSKPNENFARELLELFTLGQGHYTEGDIKEAARAFTGWMVDRGSGKFSVNRRQHDDGEKVFLGRNGRFGGDDILDILLSQPRTGEFITEKLWREFVSDNPDPQEVKRLARIFRDSGYELRPLMYALLTTPTFRDVANRGTLIKSPTELVVGTLRQFHVPVSDNRLLVRAGIQLGQNLFDPPNVKGWPGGQAWITSSSLLARYQAVDRMLRGAEMNPKPNNVVMLSGDADLGALKHLLLPIEPVNPPVAGDGWATVRGWALDPVYQLK
jgi:uncharacterized protein (DUF1800 family)